METDQFEIDKEEREWTERLNRHVSSLVADSVDLIHSRRSFISYGRRLPPLITSGKIQFAKNFFVAGLPDNRPAIREFRKKEGSGMGLFLLIPDDWLLGVMVNGEYFKDGVAEIAEKLVAIVDVHDSHIRKGREVFTREQIPDDDLVQMGVSLYSVSVNDARIS